MGDIPAEKMDKGMNVLLLHSHTQINFPNNLRNRNGKNKVCYPVQNRQNTGNSEYCQKWGK